MMMNSVLTGTDSSNKTAILDTSWSKVKLRNKLQFHDGDTSRTNRMPPLRATETVVVAINAAKDITKHALEWALTNVVQCGDQIILLTLLPGEKYGRKLWVLPKLAGDCANGLKKGPSHENRQELEEEVNDSCSFMMQQLHKLCDAKKVKVTLKVVPTAGKGTTALEAQRVCATWVVLDRQLKKEGKYCMDQLHCNLVIVRRFNSKILRLNLKESFDSIRRTNHDASDKQLYESTHGNVHYPPSEEGTSSGSPELGTSFTVTEQGTTSTSTSSDPGMSPHAHCEARGFLNPALNSADLKSGETNIDDEAASETDTTDSGVVDAISDSNTDDAATDICRTTSANPEEKHGSSTLRYCRSFDTMSQPCVESRLGRAERGNVHVESWKPPVMSRPNSANATPKVQIRQGRPSTLVSPVSISKRLSGSGRLSFSTREGAFGHKTGGSQPVISPTVSFKDGVFCHRQLQPEALRLSSNSLLPNNCGATKRVVTSKELLKKFSKWDQEAEEQPRDAGLKQRELERTSSVRRAMSLSRLAPPGPPPLCSICQHKAPVFGKPPRRFLYAELELATGGFSQANFLAEGGFGSVHRGVLPDGQAVAVKQHKLASSQGDIEFCSEVEVLSCAQHRNVVMLIGYCIEDKRRLLVYEFICNGSLDSHLYGRERDPLEWIARQKIAVGAARGLRYLHEECRVGCIVHRDMRPNNILLTHDFEPMVGDFGLARWQPDGDLGVQTRVIGTFGYLAPEYAQSGHITEKADLYSFGVVLLELVTGRKAIDINRPKGQQCLTEWARPLLDEHATQDLIDPCLEGRYSEYEAYCMLHAASLCIRKDPHARPRMSQVLRILEGDIIIDTSGSSTPTYHGKLAYNTAAYGSQSSRISSEYVLSRLGTLSPPLISYSGSLAAESLVCERSKFSVCGEPLVCRSSKLSYEELKAAYKDRGQSCRLSYEDMI